MGDWLTPAQRSFNMSSIRSKGNARTEGVLKALLEEAGLIGWRTHEALPGKPDFVFPSARVAVFVDGCFWHGCPRCYRMPEDHREYWSAKVQKNRQRDRRVRRSLREDGWTVVRVWEHALKQKQTRSLALGRIRRALVRVS